ncbi:helix-turn-helix domain-containing protein [Pseudovibrio sp. Ad5]|uniref:helix-turn-helix domain-containing protein n=1 Tax=Pseudovibrio sp. Ad5 TaxID=989436 RepID=UPI000A013927
MIEMPNSQRVNTASSTSTPKRTIEMEGRTMLTPKEVAKRWGLSDQAIRNMINRGELHGTRFGTAYRIPVSEVEQWEQSISSLATEESGSSSSKTQTQASAEEFRRARLSTI